MRQSPVLTSCIRDDTKAKYFKVPSRGRVISWGWRSAIGERICPLGVICRWLLGRLPMMDAMQMCATLDTTPLGGLGLKRAERACAGDRAAVWGRPCIFRRMKGVSPREARSDGAIVAARPPCHSSSCCYDCKSSLHMIPSCRGRSLFAVLNGGAKYN